MKAADGIGMFPMGDGVTCWLYAIGFHGGFTKMGRTTRPRQRLRELRYAYGEGKMEWAHLSAPVDALMARRAEFIALCRGGEVATRVQRTEMFNGLPRKTAIACLRYGIWYAPVQVALLEKWKTGQEADALLAPPDPAPKPAARRPGRPVVYSGS
jgi:hypothetical protein